MQLLARRTLLATLGASLAPLSDAAATDPFSAWLADLRAEARGKGIDRHTLDAALGGISPITSVIEADQRQPERRMTFDKYRRRVVSADRIDRGRELLAQNASLLQRVESRYGVPSEVMVALWGIESNFGERQGSYPVFAALATLAYEGRRASLFRRELLNALEIARRGYADVGTMQGSWAGAMGQNQFMPSTYLGYAVDFDGDGRRDIWNSLPDVFASMANYLSRSGWDARYIWGREVVAPPDLSDRRLGLDQRAPLTTWRERGVRLPDGGGLPEAEIPASLLRMDDDERASFLVYGNFRVLMAWNRSTYFGVSVGLLSDSLRDG
ncbi:MAG: lytic transglycosylase domain-containing protein [Geminicoccaceae bacterium]